jgi:hypothetical protein
MTHAVITALWCIACIALGLPWPVLFWPAAFYLGREIAQAEQRYIDTHGGHREKCPWYCGLLPQSWTLKGLLDFLLPAAVSMTAAVISAAVL